MNRAADEGSPRECTELEVPTVQIAGLPILAGRVLTPENPALSNLHTVQDCRALARQLRGQFAIVVRRRGRVIAITDAVGSYPVLYHRNVATSQHTVALRLAELQPLSSCQISEETLFGYAAYSGFVNEVSLFKDITRLPPATVALFDDNGLELSTYFSWFEELSYQDYSPDAARNHMIEIALDYLSIVHRHVGRLSCLLSSGSDSAFVAGLVAQRLQPDLGCLTVDYAIRRYSEVEGAAANASRLKVSTKPVLVGQRDYFGALEEFNRGPIDAPCAHAAALVWYQLANEAVASDAPTMLTGDHAETLFGHQEDFDGLPRSTAGYAELTAGLSAEDKLKRLVPRTNPTAEEKRLVSALGLNVARFQDWLEARREADLEFWRPLSSEWKLHTLQELRSHIWTGIPWQYKYLPVERTLDGVRFVSPFYDLELFKFSLNLPIEHKYRDGQTEAILRDFLRLEFGIDPPKRPSPLPLRWWMLERGPRDWSVLPVRLRSYYLQLCVRNYATRGAHYHDLAKVTALGRWLSAHDVEL